MNQSATANQVTLLLKSKSAEERERIANGLKNSLDTNGVALDRHVTEELARQLAEDSIERVRLTLVQSVKHSRFLPKDIAYKIAFDIERVSVPFLEVTDVFDEEELCRIVEEASDGARVAIARRGGITDKVSEALADYGGLEVAFQLIANLEASISEDAYKSMMVRHQKEGALFEEIARRPHLQSEVVAILINHVSEHLRSKLVEAYGVKLDFISPIVEEARGNALLSVIGETPTDGMRDLVLAMRSRCELTPQFLTEALQAGHFSFFVEALSLLSRTPLRTVERAMETGGLSGRSKIYTKAAIPKVLHRTFDSAVEACTLRNAQPVSSYERQAR